MSTSKQNEYLLLFRGSNWDKGLAPEQLQNIMGRINAWFERLQQQGYLKAGQPLEHEGRLVSGKSGRIVADGPFAESKEAIGGYLLLQADDLDHAATIARECPTLEYGVTAEVRPIAEECPTSRRIKAQLAVTAA